MAQTTINTLQQQGKFEYTIEYEARGLDHERQFAATLKAKTDRGDIMTHTPYMSNKKAAKRHATEKAIEAYNGMKPSTENAFSTPIEDEIIIRFNHEQDKVKVICHDTLGIKTKSEMKEAIENLVKVLSETFLED